MTIRPDQILELEKVQESLVDIVLREADPAEWVRDTAENRRERLDQKRSATHTLSMITKISSILGFLRGGQAPAANDPDESPATVIEHTDAEILAASNEAASLLKKYNDGKRKA